MPGATNVKSRWVNGNLVFYDKSGNIIFTIDGTNRKFSLPSGSTLESLGTTTPSNTGVAALLTAGLGGSVSVTKISAATDTVIAAHATKARACLVFVSVDETYAVGTGTLPTVKIGETDTIEKCMAATVLDTEAAGVVLAFAFTNTATKAIIVTTTAAVGNATGGCTVTVLAIPAT